jgi:predicted amidohydrolase
MTKAAVIQMTSTTDVQRNLAAASALLKQAADSGAVLAVLPENFALMGKHEHDKYAIAETNGSGVIQSWLSNTSRELGMWIVAGTLPIKVPGESRVAAAALIFNEQGECLARYDKMHLFDVEVNDAQGSYRESATMVHGAAPLCIDTPIGKLGMAICYDMRFPELFRCLSAQGAEIFAIPAAFTVPTGRAHWEVLLRARAVENLSYVLASAQCGTHENGRETYGHSMAIDPWGEVLECQASGVGAVIVDVDIAHLHEVRRRFPALGQRRL